MKKINRKIFLYTYTSLLGFSTFSSCVQIKQGMNRPILGKEQRTYNMGPKKLLIGAARFLAIVPTAGSGLSANSLSVSNRTSLNTIEPTISPIYNLSKTDFSSRTGLSSDASIGATLAYNAYRPDVSTRIESTPIRSKSSETYKTESDSYTIDIKYIKYLVENHKDLNERYSFDRTALMIAIDEGLDNISKLLIDNNADVDLQDILGTTALMSAARFDKRHIARLLINKKANLNLQDACGETALLIAIRNEHDDIAKLLINSNVDVNLPNEKNETPLIYTIKYDRIDIAKLLIDNNVDVNLSDINKHNALWYARKNGNKELVKLLIEHGAIDTLS